MSHQKPSGKEIFITPQREHLKLACDFGLLAGIDNSELGSGTSTFRAADDNDCDPCSIIVPHIICVLYQRRRLSLQEQMLSFLW